MTHVEPPGVAAAADGHRQSPGRTALAGLAGNVVEWFDFAVYGYFLGAIGGQFFPRSDPAAQQLLAFAVFALGFGARPFGSLVLGRLGDRRGRRALLTTSIALMAASTLAIGLLPTYDQVGIAAPLLLVAMRLIQGFSLGGEFTGSMVYTTEAASPLTRGLVSSSTAAGVTLGFMLASGSAWLANVLLRPDQVSAWGWRLPFVASVGLCAVAWWLGRGLRETDEGLKAAAARPPLLASLAADWLPMLRTFGIVATTNAAYYVGFAYVVERRHALAGGGGDFFLATTLSLVVVLIAKPAGGWLSDRVGRRRLMLDPDGGDHGDDRSGHAPDARGRAGLVRARAVPPGGAAGPGARPPGRHARRDLPAAQPRQLDERRLQRLARARRRDGAAGVRVVDRHARRAAGARVLHRPPRRGRARLAVADGRDERAPAGSMTSCTDVGDRTAERVAARGIGTARYAWFARTAARISAFSAGAFTFAPSRKSIARRTLPSRLALKRPFGSSSEAPLGNVSLTCDW
jgi:MFS transporter, MHS family, proline/betaine transporter